MEDKGFLTVGWKVWDFFSKQHRKSGLFCKRLIKPFFPSITKAHAASLRAESHK